VTRPHGHRGEACRRPGCLRQRFAPTGVGRAGGDGRSTAVTIGPPEQTAARRHRIGPPSTATWLPTNRRWAKVNHPAPVVRLFYGTDVLDEGTPEPQSPREPLRPAMMRGDGPSLAASRPCVHRASAPAQNGQSFERKLLIGSQLFAMTEPVSATDKGITKKVPMLLSLLRSPSRTLTRAASACGLKIEP
jgi:hypothetical protein